MTYALDANTISFLLRSNRNPEVELKFEEIISQGHDYVIPAICHFEVNWNLLLKKATTQLKVFNNIYSKSLRKVNFGESEIILAARIKVGFS